jgi:predicted amidohydrolase YtcJ
MYLLHNARIHTLDPRQPTAFALVIDDGRIRAVGDESLVEEFDSKGQRIDLGGRTIIPGLMDAHIHLSQYALGLQQVDCETATRAECLRRVAERVAHTPPGEWILGHGWNQNEWSEGFGRAADLDAIAPANPVYLTAKSVHAAWVNTLAMQMAGISASTADPPGGRIQRDEQGNPTGILFESAMQLVDEVIPPCTPHQIAQAIREAQTQLWQFGVTGVHDFDSMDCFSALQLLRANGELGIRVLKGIPLEAMPHAIQLGLRSGFGDDFLRIGAVKMFADGALGPRTAAMFQPYLGEPQNCGMLLMNAEEIFDHGRQAVTHGLSLAIHAIGDRAVHEVLDAFERLRALEASQAMQASIGGQASSFSVDRRWKGFRHRIEHVQIIQPEDCQRMAELDLIASMQPIHATSDYAMADRYWGERAQNAYAWRLLMNHGVHLAFGSDAPVESPNPFWGLHAAVTRRRRDGTPGAQGWYPQHRLNVHEALQGFTRGVAYAAGMEDHLGMLSPGYLADLLVLSEDPLACPMEQLAELYPLATMVGGKWVYGAPEFALIMPFSVSSHPPDES